MEKLNFNNSKPDSPKSEAEAGLEAEAEKYRVLDECEEIPYFEKYALVGVLIGVKPATEIEIIGEENEIYYMQQSTEVTLDELGLIYRGEEPEECEEPGYLSATYYVAKDEQTLQKLQQLRNDSRHAESPEQAQAIERELGRIFGYPETAIEYFVTEWGLNGQQNVSDTNKKYHSYIHSPTHAEEEHRQYEQIIDAAFRERCPKSADEMFHTEE